ncbi:MAG: cytochrome c, partial [Ulvibacter sp.]|nr:cytochrome c [Ulvibacter sp.]
MSVVTLALALSLSTNVLAQATPADDAAAVSANGGDAALGEKLFKANCAACHKLYKKATGPALYSVGDKYEKEWLYSWIKNSAALIASGDSRANAIFEEYNKSAMNVFPGLSDKDIDDIVAYTYTEKKVSVAPAALPG